MDAQRNLTPGGGASRDRLWAQVPPTTEAKQALRECALNVYTRGGVSPFSEKTKNYEGQIKAFVLACVQERGFAVLESKVGIQWDLGCD